MKHIIYECDWCHAKEDAPNVDDWPAGWTTLDEYGFDDLLCLACVTIGREAVRTAVQAAKAARSLGKTTAVATELPSGEKP